MRVITNYVVQYSKINMPPVVTILSYADNVYNLFGNEKKNPGIKVESRRWWF